MPDRTLLLRIDPEPGARASTGAARRPTASSARTRASSRPSPPAYETLAAAEPERIRVLDAAQDPTAVLAEAIGALSDLLA